MSEQEPTRYTNRYLEKNLSGFDTGSGEAGFFSWFRPAEVEFQRLVWLRPPTGEPARDPDTVLTWGSAGERYRPLEAEPDLFLEFVDVPLSSDSVLAFARQHGPLYIGDMYIRSALKKGRRPIIPGNRLSKWFETIATMREAVEVWRLLSSGEDAELRHRLEWQGTKGRYSVLYKSEARREAIANQQHGFASSFFDRWKRGDIIGPARLFLARSINKGMRGAVSPQLLMDDTGNFRPYTTPTSLAAALWFQFYAAVIANTPIRRCSECGALMVCHNSRKRMHAACGNKARVRRSRAKRTPKNG